MSNLKVKEETRVSVLVVDDEASICSSLCDVLGDENYDTFSASNGKEAK